jgi:hypothetical protein
MENGKWIPEPFSIFHFLFSFRFISGNVHHRDPDRRSRCYNRACRHIVFE